MSILTPYYNKIFFSITNPVSLSALSVQLRLTVLLAGEEITRFDGALMVVPILA